MEGSTQTVLILGAVFVVGGLGLYLLSSRPVATSTADPRAEIIQGATDQGSAERTAWVGLFTEGLRTFGTVYTTERGAARADAGASVPTTTTRSAIETGAIASADTARTTSSYRLY